MEAFFLNTNSDSGLEEAILEGTVLEKEAGVNQHGIRHRKGTKVTVGMTLHKGRPLATISSSSQVMMRVMLGKRPARCME